MLYWVIMLEEIVLQILEAFLLEDHFGSSNTSDYLWDRLSCGNQTSAGTRYNIHIGNEVRL